MFNYTCRIQQWQYANIIFGLNFIYFWLHCINWSTNHYVRYSILIESGIFIPKTNINMFSFANWNLSSFYSIDKIIFMKDGWEENEVIEGTTSWWIQKKIGEVVVQKDQLVNRINILWALHVSFPYLVVMYFLLCNSEHLYLYFTRKQEDYTNK